MFDVGIGYVGGKKRECLGHFDLCVHIERAVRVRLNIKEVITDPVAPAVYLKFSAKSLTSPILFRFSTEKQNDYISFRGINLPCVLLSLDFHRMPSESNLRCRCVRCVDEAILLYFLAFVHSF